MTPLSDDYEERFPPKYLPTAEQIAACAEIRKPWTCAEHRRRWVDKRTAGEQAVIPTASESSLHGGRKFDSLESD
jgi:hypothetical protein